MSLLFVRPAQEIRSDLRSRPEFSAALDSVRARAAFWRDHFADRVEDVTGWGHNYVCPKCAGPLTYDSTRRDWHDCKVCDGKGEGQDVREAWMHFYRHDMARGLMDIALLSMIGEPGYTRDMVLEKVLWYAERYPDFPEHGRWAGRGKVMGQSLCEAVWGIELLHALQMIGLAADSAEARALHHKMFLPMARLVMAQSGVIHNIPLWHAACAVGVAAVFDDKRLMDQSLGYSQDVWRQAQMGGFAQVTQGFTQDGLWYENSFGYHYYALEAATYLCTFLREIGMDVPEINQRVLRGYISPLQMAFEGGEVPAMNDGWRGTNALQNLGRLRRAYHILHDQPGADELARAIWHDEAAANAPSLGALLHGTPPRPVQTGKPASVNLPGNCIAMLRGAADVYLKYGNLSASHAHPDALHIDIYPWARDTGTPGYGSLLHRTFFTQSVVHNTFVVDGQNQSRVVRGTCALSPDGRELTAEVADAYPGIFARRTLRMEGEKLCDELSVRADAPHTIDYVFHAAGAFAATGEWEEDALAQKENGYQHLASVRKCVGEEPVFTWAREGCTLTMRFAPQAEGAAVYTAVSPDNPGHLTRTCVLVRVQAAEAVFRAVFSFS